MIKSILYFFAKRTHEVRTQLLLATLYGLVAIYGVGGGLSIILKAKKIAKPKPRNRVTVKKDIPQ